MTATGTNAPERVPRAGTRTHCTAVCLNFTLAGSAPVRCQRS